MRNLTTLWEAAIVSLYYKSWIVKGPRCLALVKTQFREKTNRHLDKIKGGTGGLEDIEKATNDLLQVSSLLPVFLGPRVSFSVSALPSPSFPLTHPLMVIYLRWKGLRFLTGEIDNIDGSESRAASKKKKKKKEREKERARTGEKNEEIYHSCRSPRWHRLSLPLTLTAVMEVKVWPQTERGEKKKNYMSIFVPTGCQDRNRYITFS